MENFNQLIPEFGLLTLSVLLFLGVILHYRLYRKSMAIFYLIILTELYTPACFFMAGETSYLKFGPEALRLYMLIGALAFVCYALIFAGVQRLRFQERRLIFSRLDVVPARKACVLWLFVMCVIGMVAIYLVHFREGLSLYQAVFHNAKIRIRPDSSDDVPHWFTFAAIVTIALPTFHLYYYRKRGFRKITNFTLICLISLAMASGGNKGFLVYWYIFLWIYLWKMRIDGRVIAVGAVSIVFTTIIMGGGMTNISLASLKEFAVYGIRRFSLSQGAMLINRLEMILQDYPFNFTYIANQVFPFVYGEDSGSAPTYFLGDLLVQFGFVGGFLLHLLVIIVFAIVGRYLDRRESNEYKIYLFFCAQYFLGMAGISISFLYRFLLVLGLALVFSLLEKPLTATRQSDDHSLAGLTPNKRESIKTC